MGIASSSVDEPLHTLPEWFVRNNVKIYAEPPDDDTNFAVVDEVNSEDNLLGRQVQFEISRDKYEHILLTTAELLGQDNARGISTKASTVLLDMRAKGYGDPILGGVSYLNSLVRHLAQDLEADLISVSLDDLDTLGLAFFLQDQERARFTAKKSLAVNEDSRAVGVTATERLPQLEHPDGDSPYAFFKFYFGVASERKGMTQTQMRNRSAIRTLLSSVETKIKARNFEAGDRRPLLIHLTDLKLLGDYRSRHWFLHTFASHLEEYSATEAGNHRTILGIASESAQYSPSIEPSKHCSNSSRTLEISVPPNYYDQQDIYEESEVSQTRQYNVCRFKRMLQANLGKAFRPGFFDLDHNGDQTRICWLNDIFPGKDVCSTENMMKAVILMMGRWRANDVLTLEDVLTVTTRMRHNGAWDSEENVQSKRKSRKVGGYSRETDEEKQHRQSSEEIPPEQRNVETIKEEKEEEKQGEEKQGEEKQGEEKQGEEKQGEEKQGEEKQGEEGSVGDCNTWDGLSPEQQIQKLSEEYNDHEQGLFDCVIDRDSLSTSYDDVIIDEKTKNHIQHIILLSRVKPKATSKTLLEALSVSGSLFYGAPGTGKTLLCRAIAKSSGYNMVTLSPAEVMRQYYGESEKMISAAFSLATKLSPCILFIDEADALFYRRGNNDRSWERALTNQFLQEMDGLKVETKETVPLVIVGTNRPGDLDDAFLRRLPHKVFFPLPTSAERKRILRVILHDDDIDPDLDLGHLADSTKGFSGSDLRNLCSQASLAWFGQEQELQAGREVSELRVHLRQSHFEVALQRTKPTVSPQSVKALEEFTKRFNPEDYNRLVTSMNESEVSKEVLRVSTAVSVSDPFSSSANSGEPFSLGRWLLDLFDRFDFDYILGYTLAITTPSEPITVLGDSNTKNSPVDFSANESVCSSCFENGVSELLDDLRNGTTARLSREKSFEHFIRDDTSSDPTVGLSGIIGTFSERIVNIGKAVDIISRKSCPMCQIVSHVLTSEFRLRKDLSCLKIELHFPSREYPGPPALARMANVAKGVKPTRARENILYVSTRTDSALLTLGSIRFLSLTQNQKKPVETKHKVCFQPHAQLSTFLELLDAVEKIKQDAAKLQLDAADDTAWKNMLPILHYLDRSCSTYDERKKMQVDDSEGTSALVLRREDVERAKKMQTVHMEGLGSNGDTDMTGSNGKDVVYVNGPEFAAVIREAASKRTSIVSVDTELQILLIDVNDRKLIEANTETKYLALSYVWGTGKVFKTTTETRKKLEMKNSLKHEELPRIVQDAMSFTRKMQQRYLWVDALCIEQNEDSEQKKSQILNMDRIYRDAYLTLVAWTATGSNSGLYGISDLDSDQKYHYKPQLIQRHVNGLVLENRLTEDLDLMHHYAHVSHYDTRAWTFQEKVLSKRCIFFHEREALFVYDLSEYSVGLTCAGSGLGSDCVGSQVMRVPKKGRSLSADLRRAENAGIISVAPHLEQYGYFVEHYMQLNLTVESDRLNAFQGLLAHIRSDIGETVAGLPIASSPRVLLWRRADKDQAYARNPKFPSWSWAGWQGHVRYFDFASSNWEFNIQEIRGSVSPDSRQKIIWSRNPQTLLDETDTTVHNSLITVLHFAADTIDPATSTSNLPSLPKGHIYFLLAIEIDRTEGPRNVQAMEVSRTGECFERVTIHTLERTVWENATAQRRLICLK